MFEMADVLAPKISSGELIHFADFCLWWRTDHGGVIVCQERQDLLY